MDRRDSGRPAGHLSRTAYTLAPEGKCWAVANPASPYGLTLFRRGQGPCRPIAEAGLRQSLAE